MKESQLLNYAMARLWQERSWLEYDRANSGRIKYSDSKGKSRMVRGHKAGTPDITGLFAPHGKSFGIELKVGNNKQTELQHTYEERVSSLGALYFLVYTPEELERAIKFMHDQMVSSVVDAISFTPAQQAFRQVEVQA